MKSRLFVGATAAAAGFAALPALAQSIVVIGQDRSITGSNSGITDSGPVDNPPVTISAPEGDYSEWRGEFTLPGPMLVSALQRSAFNGDNEIRLDEFQMNFSGGGGPGTEGIGRLETRTSFTFLATADGDFAMTGGAGCGAFVTLSLSITGPGVDVSRTSGPDGALPLDGITGSLRAGETYTLSFVGQGEVSYVGPGGNGSGAGGGLPVWVFTVGGGGSCVADFNGDGFVDFFDYDDYVNCFETSACPDGRTADVNGDEFVDFFDYDEYVSAFESGC